MPVNEQKILLLKTEIEVVLKRHNITNAAIIYVTANEEIQACELVHPHPYLRNVVLSVYDDLRKRLDTEGEYGQIENLENPN